MTPTDSGIKTAGAIQAEMELTINAPRKVVWDAFVNATSEWWHKDFYTSKGPAKFVVDLKLGGHMYEDAGLGAGIVWFTILGIWPEEKLWVVGYTCPPFGGPATGLITFELVEKSDTVTIFKVSDATHGHVTADLASNAEGGWRMLFSELKKHAEKL